MGQVEYIQQNVLNANETLATEIIKSHYSPLWAICVIATVGLIMVNTIGNDIVSGDGFGMDEQTMCARLYLFLGFLMLLSGLVSSIWLMASKFATTQDVSVKCTQAEICARSSFGVALLAQNLMIFFGAVIFKFGRVESGWGAY